MFSNKVRNLRKQHIQRAVNKIEQKNPAICNLPREVFSFGKSSFSTARWTTNNHYELIDTKLISSGKCAEPLNLSSSLHPPMMRLSSSQHNIYKRTLEDSPQTLLVRQTYKYPSKLLSRKQRIGRTKISSNFPFCSYVDCASFEVEDDRFDVYPMRDKRVQCRTFSTAKSSQPHEQSSSNATVSPDAASFSTSAQSIVMKKDSTYSEKAKDIMARVSKSIYDIILATPGVLWFYLTHPKDFRQKMLDLKEAAKKEAHHYWMGTKLLAADVTTARQLVARTLRGSTLTRRERKQLIRTVTDMFRLVPMSMFVLIPFMEFALPFALKLFPNMLPSTFQDSLKSEENMKGELQARIAMAGFFQETLQNLAKEQKTRAEKNKVDAIASSTCDGTFSEKEETARSFLDFIEKSRNGEFMPPDVIIRYAKYFQDDLTLDNMSRMQLINMCKYMGIPPYGADSLLRFQLRHRNRTLKEDDQRILWEGIDSLTKMELREACRERGMRSIGLSKNAYKFALQQWLDLSVNKDVPISILIMSRTFFLREEMETASSGTKKSEDPSIKAVAGIADAISGLEREVVNEVVLDVASKSVEDHKDPDLVAIKLEVLEQQNDLIEEEYKERESAKKKKEESKTVKEKEEVDSNSSLDDDQIEKAEMVSSPAPEYNLSEVEDKKMPSTFQDNVKAKEDSSVREMKSTAGTDFSEVDTKTTTEDEDSDSEKELSAEELKAISQLLSPNAVQTERDELDLIKAAIAADEETSEGTRTVREDSGEKDETSHVGVTSVSADDESITETQQTNPDDEIYASTEIEDSAAKTIEAQEKAVTVEANEATSIDFAPTSESEITEDELPSEESPESTKLDQSIAKLRSKVQSMVGNIELQIADVEAKIGDKMHLLDKDKDGILSKEEISEVLQQVLKRDLTPEDAMDIACEMDENKDGFMTVEELIRWMETNQLVKLVEEGRDAEVDYEISLKAAKFKDEQNKESDVTGKTV